MVTHDVWNDHNLQHIFVTKQPHNNGDPTLKRLRKTNGFESEKWFFFN